MAKLTTKKRKALPVSDFVLFGRQFFEKSKVDAKARRVLGKRKK